MDNITQGGNEDRVKIQTLILMVFIRLFLAVLSQAIIAGAFFLHGDLSPWKSAASWWMVYGTLIDIGCLALLFFLTKREETTVMDLIGYRKEDKGKDILTGLGYFLLFFMITMVSTLLTGIWLFGSPQPPSATGKLPLLGALYAMIVWPLVWGSVEQMTYQGYVLPRLQRSLGHKWASILIIAFGWGLQHIALPLTFDLRFMLFRFLSTFPLAVVMLMLYMRKKRLLPFVISHWALDFTAALTGVFLPSILMR